jgi:O-antigen/teichoic acid export membrane protein
VKPVPRNPAASQFIVVAAYATTVALSLALTVLLGRNLTPGDFGFFALVVALFAFAREVIDLGTTATASREMGRDSTLEQQLLEGLYYVRRIVAFALAAFALFLASLQDDSSRRMVLVGAAAALAILGPTAYNASFQWRQALLAPSIAAFATQLLLLVACAYLVVHGITGTEQVALVVVREIAFIVAIAYLGRRLVRFRVTPRLHFTRIRAFYAAAGIWAVAVMCRHLFVQSDVLVVYLVQGSMELGAWAAAYRVVAPLYAIPWIIVVPLIPVLAALGDSRAGSALLESTLLLGCGVGALLSLCVVAAAPALITLLYGGKYLAAPLDAIPSMRWLGLAIAPSFVIETVAAGLLISGRVRAVLAVSATGLALKTIANVVLVPILGFVAVTVTTAIMELAASVALCLALPLRWKALRRRAAIALTPALVTGLLVWAVATWIDTPVLQLIMISCVGVGGLAALLCTGTARTYFRRLHAARTGMPGSAPDVSPSVDSAA